MLKVLIVEDEAIIRRGLELAIDWTGMGCVVTGVAADGEEGLKLISEKKPDIVLADIRMPKLSGLEMIEKALQKDSFYSIVLTSYSEFDLAKEAIHIGVTDYLLKPVDEDELKGTIDKIREKISEKDEMKKIEEFAGDKVLSADSDWKIIKTAESSEDTYVNMVYKIIKENYSDELSIRDVAEELKVSPSFLSRRLKQNLDTTFVDILNQYRIKSALKLLSEGKMRIYEVSDAVGFNEYKHFSSVFKKYLGVSPGEFMRTGMGIVSSLQRENKSLKEGRK